MRVVLRTPLVLVLLTLGFASARCLAQDLQVADVAFIDEQHGWVSVLQPAPTILHTSDGGFTWERIPLQLKNGLYRLHFINAQTGVGLQSESDGTAGIYRTVDAGQTWVNVAAIGPPHGESLVDLAVTNSGDIFIVGEGTGGRGYVAQIPDRGEMRQRTDLPVDINREPETVGIFGDGAGHLWIVGKELILHSADNGKTWENQYLNTMPKIDLAISGWALPGGHAWVAVANFEIYRTEDYGKHWARALTTAGAGDINFDSVSFSTPEAGCALGNSPFIYCTRDGGITWSKTNAFPNYVRDSLRTRLFLFPSSHGWATINGAFYKTLDAGQSFREVLTNTAPIEADLSGETQALRTSINGPTELAYDKAGFLYIIEAVENRLLRLNVQHASIKTILQRPDDTDTDFAWPSAIAVDQRSNVFIGDFNGRIRKLDGHSGDITELVPSSPSFAARVLDNPVSMAADAQGNVLIVDRQHKLFRWRPHAGLETVAGTGAGTFAGDGASARAASLHFPSGIAVDDGGDIFIADYESCRIRKVDHKTQIISTIAGNGECASSGDGGRAIEATLNYPSSLVVDKNGNLFFVEGATARVRRIDRFGIITTYAGTGQKGFRGDGGAATEAMLNNPSGLAVDEGGNLYIADFVNNRIRRVDSKTHVITTVAGNGKPVRVDVLM